MSSDKKTPHNQETETDKKWNSTFHELKSAFNAWDKLPLDSKNPKEISATPIPSAPDEKKINEVKELLNDLKNQLKSFEDL